VADATNVWIDVCGVGDIEEEDVLRVDCEGRTYAIYRSPEGTFHATDGICTHEHAHLADGLVIDDVVECPKHNGRFNYKTGEAKRAPVCVDLRTYPVRVDSGRVLMRAS
jgi:3-phenylpropionate/trans-cinnamate dioxygenase ferredoxin subunit